MNGSKYLYLLIGEVLKVNDDQGSELEQKVYILLIVQFREIGIEGIFFINSIFQRNEICVSFIVLVVVGLICENKINDEKLFIISIIVILSIISDYDKYVD